MQKVKRSKKRELLQLSYPQNLIMTLLNGRIEFTEMTDDIQVGLEFVLLSLSDIEREILKLRFEDRLTYAQIGDMKGRTPNRAREIESNAFRKLRRYPIIGYIFYGKEEFAKRNYIFHWPSPKVLSEQISTASTVYTMPIEDLDLNIRSYNILCRAGYRLVGEIVNLSYEQINAISHLPRKTCKEIAWKLFYLGFEETVWQHL